MDRAWRARPGAAVVAAAVALALLAAGCRTAEAPASAPVAAESSTPLLPRKVLPLLLPGPGRQSDPNRDVARLCRQGIKYVLVTGTHDSTPEVVNTLYHRGGVLRADTWQRLPGSYHGSGCTLAAALAANLARGLEIGDAVYEAQDYTWQALAHAFRPGMGQHLPDRLFWAREAHGEDDE